MFPNPQDALPLPPRPDLDQYRKLARDLVTAAATGDPALVEWAARWINALERLNPGLMRIPARRRDRFPEEVAAFARSRLPHAGASITKAQFVIARVHGFESWPKLVHHVEEMTHSGSDISTFERAADAIVEGDLLTLERLLKEEPALIRARSSREHRATLLHHVAANGVENYRQRTPANIVAIARYLLDAGAEVDAEAEMYGGGSTTFGLVVTSAHPRLAGTQNELADLLLARGARMARSTIHDCLANGCPEVAGHLAELGAHVNFVDAAGLGRSDLVRQMLEQPGGVPLAEQGEAMEMAGWYRQREVIKLMIELGVDPAVRSGPAGFTVLHVSASYGDLDLVQTLIQRGAPVNAADGSGYTPIQWALHAWLDDKMSPRARPFPRLCSRWPGPEPG